MKKNMFLGDDNEKLRTFRVSCDVVRMKLNKLKMNKAPDIDLVVLEC